MLLRHKVLALNMFLLKVKYLIEAVDVTEGHLRGVQTQFPCVFIEHLRIGFQRNPPLAHLQPLFQRINDETLVMRRKDGH